MTLTSPSRMMIAAGPEPFRIASATPPGVPDAFLVPVERPLESLIRRYARHHGPFLTREAAARFDLHETHAAAGHRHKIFSLWAAAGQGQQRIL